MRRWLPLVIVLAFALSAYGVLNGRRSNAARRREICVQVEVLKRIVREDKQTQLQRAEAYLRRHPHGTPGIPRELILQGIHDQRRTVSQLQPVKC